MSGPEVLHLDMDCFFAAVEVQRDPLLAKRPVVVGGTGVRGVVASASYEARTFGIRSAMPTAEARRLCPHAEFLPARFGAYNEASRRLRAILDDVTPIVEPVALDEAYLDVAGAHRLLGSSASIATMLRRRVAAELGLDCSVGVGTTKLIAKLASKAGKPTWGPLGIVAGPGVVVIEPVDELAFLHRHPVRAVPGVGPRTAERLARFGVSSVGDLAAVSRDSLVRLLGASSGHALHDLAWGRDRRPVMAERAARSIGHEETFPEDLHDVAHVDRQARAAAAAVAARCRAAGVAARSVTVKVRFADFATATRSRTLAAPVDTAAAIGDVACELISGLRIGAGVRLVGVHASQLVPADAVMARQLALFRSGGASPSSAGEPAGDVRDDIEAATEAIRRRFGAAAIAPLAERARPGPGRGPAGPLARQ